MLKTELDKITKQFKENAPKEIADAIFKGIEDLAESKLLEKALKVGDKMPSFKLTNATGKIVDSESLLEDGPLVINFYRGGW